MQSDSTYDSMDFDNFMAWLHYNRKPVGVIATIVVAAALAFSLYNWNKNQKEVKANAALFALPSLVGTGEQAKDVHAEQFQKIAQEYPNTLVANRAEIIAAGLLFANKKYDEAQKSFGDFINQNPTSPLLSEAALGVAASLEAQGKISEAIVKYEELIAKYSGTPIVAPAKLTLARLLETQNKPTEALRLYDELMGSKNPYDPWAAEARERRELLLQKYPELKPKPSAATPAVSTGSPIINLSAPAPVAATNKSSAK